MEQRREVKVIQVTLTCDNCGSSNIRHTSVELLTYPPQYPYFCMDCEHRQTAKHLYPYLEYEEVSTNKF